MNNRLQVFAALLAENTATNTVVRTITTDSQAEPGLQSIAVSPDGTQIYLTDLADGVVRVLTITPGSVVI